MIATSRFLGSRRFICIPMRERGSLLAPKWRNLQEPRNLPPQGNGADHWP